MASDIVLIFQVSFAHYKNLMYTMGDDNCVIAWDPIDIYQAASGGTYVANASAVQAASIPFKAKIRKYLKDVQIDAR